MTWIELYALFRSMGYGGVVKGKGGKAAAKPGLRSILQQFKLLTRRSVKILTEENRQYFSPGLLKGYALKRLGIINHFATVNMKVKLNSEVQRHLDKELLRANGCKKKDLEEVSKGKKTSRAQALYLKHKVNWSDTVVKLPEKVLKEWPEENLQNVEYKRPLKKQEVTQATRRVSASLPRTEVVGVVLKVAGKKRACTEGEGPKLTPGMLRGKLLQRFGHLCTEPSV